MASFRRECWQFIALYLAVFDSKVQRFCWPKGTSLESIYVEITEAACVCDELCRLKEEEEEEIVSLGDSRVKRVRDNIAILSMLTVTVVVLEYSQLHKKA